MVRAFLTKCDQLEFDEPLPLYKVEVRLLLAQMVLRWTAAGMFNAERSFRRIKGRKRMPQLVAALHRHATPTPKLSVPPPSVHRGSPPKFHVTRNMLKRRISQNGPPVACLRAMVSR
jgi:hypothetical protein